MLQYFIVANSQIVISRISQPEIPVIIESSSFWDVTPCSLVEAYRCFGAAFSFAVFCLFDLLLYREDGSNSVNFHRTKRRHIHKTVGLLFFSETSYYYVLMTTTRYFRHAYHPTRIYQCERRHVREYRNVNVDVVITKCKENDNGIASLSGHSQQM
jgi:hypothetical protein